MSVEPYAIRRFQVWKIDIINPPKRIKLKLTMIINPFYQHNYISELGELSKIGDSLAG